MAKNAEVKLKKQYKLLKKAMKAELKKSLKASPDSAKLLTLSKLDIELLAKEVVSNALSDRELLIETQVIHEIKPKPTNMSFALKPFKKSACKKCPALNGGLCKCAIKHNNKKQISSVS